MPDSVKTLGEANASSGVAARWMFACASGAVKPGAQLRVMIEGEPVLVGRDARGAVFAMRDVCPHRGVPLSAGRQVLHEGETTVECPYHGWRFGADGGCRLIPSLVEGQPWSASRIRVRAWTAHDGQGLIRVTNDLEALPPAPLALPGAARIVVELSTQMPAAKAASRLSGAAAFVIGSGGHGVHCEVTPQSETQTLIALAIGWEPSLWRELMAGSVRRRARRWLEAVFPDSQPRA